MADEDQQTESADTSAEVDDDGPSSTAEEPDGVDAPASAGDDSDERRESAVARLSDDYWTERRKRRVLAVVVAAMVLILVSEVRSSQSGPSLGSVPRLWAGDERTPGETVSAFFLAQADGDCERLTDDLLTEDSWSQGGRLTRGQFLDRCAEAVDGYQPDVGDVSVEIGADDGNRASVNILTTDAADVVDQNPGGADDPEGRLVREDGEWKVQTDPAVLHLGRSVEETIAAYVDAYNTGDCDTLLDVLAEDVWSRGGDLDRDQFLDACEQSAARREERIHPAIAAAPSALVIDGSQATATFQGGYVAPHLSDVEDEEVTFSRDGFEWKIAGSGDGDADNVVPWAPFRFVQRSELQSVLLDEVTRDGASCLVYFDGAARPDDGPPGVEREFSHDCSAVVTLFQLGDADAARAYAEQRATEIAQDPPPTAEELTGNGTTPEEAAQQAADYRPNQPVAVPGMPDAHGVRRGCHVDGCYFGVAIATAGDYVVMVEDQTSDDLTYATGVLQSQMEVLS